MRLRSFLTMLFCFLALDLLATNAPSNLAATAVSNNQVNLTWTDNSNDESGFTFRFDTNSAFTNPTYVYAGGANTTSHSHTGRSTATTYYYQIKAEGNPDSGWTSADSATTAPSSLTAAATSNSAVGLTWSGNGGNGAIQGYTYAYAGNSAFTGATYVYVSGNGSTSTSRSGLSTATTYWWKIKAEGTSDAYDSPYSAAVAATTTPTSLAASTASSTQINLAWSGNSGNANVTGYTYAVATNTSFTGAAYHFVNGAGSTTTSNTGLAPGTTYYYKIKAEGTSNAYDSPFTAYITASTSSTAPAAPTGLSASAFSSSQINLSWTDNSNDETGFELKRATDSGFTQNVVWIGGIQGTSYSNTGLAASTTYYYKVRAQGATQNSAYTSSASATTNAASPPNAPSGLTATSVSGSQINLSWTDNSNDETGFEVKRATDSGFTQNVVWIGNIQGASYASTGLSPSTTYYYKVRAEGTAGKSSYSASASATTGGSSGSIPAHFFGINAWMPYNIGRRTPAYNGKLLTDPDEPIWDTITASGVRLMRYGGRGVDKHANPMYEETMEQYVAMTEAMRANDIVPVLQVPMFGKYSAEQAADIVRRVNIAANGSRLPRAVDYWVIGNEPDLTGAAEEVGYGGNGYSATQIAAYLKSFALAMKEVDPLIKIIGPETAWYHDSILNALTTCSPPGNENDVTGHDGGVYYLDYISFHTYPYDGSQSDRANIIGKLMGDDGFDEKLGLLQDRVADCNSEHGRFSNPLKVAVTEVNINHEGNYDAGADGLAGYGPKSFLGGQFWAEMMGIALQRGVDFMTFWSTVEGNGLSYLASDGVTKRPSYYHFQMMANSFRGDSVTVLDTQSSVKTFAAVDSDQIAVLILNQNGTSSFDYTVRLNDGTVSGTRPLKINVPAGLAVEYPNTIGAEASVLLLFNSSGTLTKRIEYSRTGPSAPTEY